MSISKAQEDLETWVNERMGSRRGAFNVLEVQLK